MKNLQKTLLQILTLKAVNSVAASQYPCGLQGMPVIKPAKTMSLKAYCNSQMPNVFTKTVGLLCVEKSDTAVNKSTVALKKLSFVQNLTNLTSNNLSNEEATA
jgi:hypothetical protein